MPGVHGTEPSGRVVVVGSLNMDLAVTVERLPDAGATVPGTDYRRGAGGKGLNQAVAAARFGCPTAIVGAVGDDAAGRELRAVLGEEGIGAAGVAVAPGPSGIALVTVDAAGDNTIVVAAGANASLTPESAAAGVAAALATPSPSGGDVVVAQLEVPVDAVVAAFREGRSRGATCVLNPAPAQAVGALPLALLGLADVVVPNANEATTLTGHADPTAAAAALLDAGCATVVVTLGERGALLAGGGGMEALPAFPVTAVDATAAGDAFCSTLAACLAAGAELRAAARLACAAGALTTTTRGAAASLPAGDAVRSLAARAPAS